MKLLKQKSVFAFAAAVALVAASAPANAVSFVLTVKGTVTSGSLVTTEADSGSIVSRQKLAGQNFLARIVYDGDVNNPTITSTARTSKIVDDTGLIASSIFFSVGDIFRYTSRTYDTLKAAESALGGNDRFSLSQTGTRTTRTQSYSESLLTSFVTPEGLFASPSFDESFVYKPGSGDFFHFLSTHTYTDAASGLGYVDDLKLSDSNSPMVFRFSSVSPIAAFAATRFAPVSSVPESSTWALMILGFGLTGLALRRRKAPKILSW